MNRRVRAVAGIDLGGTRIKAILRHARDGAEIDRKILETGDGVEVESPPGWASVIRDLIHGWEQEHQIQVERVGLACPGLAHRDGNRSVLTRSGGRFTSTCDLTDAVNSGDADARVCWEKSLFALACGIASLVNVIDPEVVLLGGGVAQVGDLLFPPCRRCWIKSSGGPEHPE